VRHDLLPDDLLPDDLLPEDLLPDDRRRASGLRPTLPEGHLRRAATWFRAARAAPSTARWSWALAVVLVIAGVALTLDAQREAVAVRRAFGHTATVWVAGRDVAPGTTLTPADVRQRELPVALLPAPVLTAGDDPTGRTALTPLAAGEVLLAHHLSGDPAAGPAAMLPPGSIGLTLPAGTDRPGLVAGQAVVLVLTGEPDPGRSGASGLVAGVVAATGGPDGTVMVGVPAAETVRVAAAVQRGTVTVALPAPSGSAALRPRTGSTG